MPERNISSDEKILYREVHEGQPVQFEFAANEAHFTRNGNDLNATLEGGAQVITEGYFVAESNGSLPSLQFASGEEMSGEEFLAEVNPEMDLTPATAAVSAGGLGAYNDAPGDLVGGLELSGDLGNFQWASEGGPTEEFISATALNDKAPDITAPPAVTPPTPTTPTPPDGYDARAVLYSVDPDNKPIADPTGATLRFSLPEGTDIDSVKSTYGLLNDASLIKTSTVNGVDYYTIMLSGDGVDALQKAAGQPGAPENVYDYFTITMDDGQEFVIQIILNQTGDYSTADENLAKASGHPTDVPEWHLQVSESRVPERALGDADDEMWLDYHLSAIHAADADAANVDGHNYANVIDLGGGNNTLHIRGSIFTGSSTSNSLTHDSLVTSGDGNDTINVGLVVQGRDANNVIDTGKGDDVVNIHGAVEAVYGGTTLIKVEEGDVNLGSNLKAFGNTNNVTQSNTIIANNINMTSETSVAEGVMAYGANSENRLHAANDINININSVPNMDLKFASTGMYATASSADPKVPGEEAKNLLEAGGNINVSSTFDSYLNGEALGVYTNGPHALLNMDAGGDISITSTAAGTGDSKSVALWGNNESYLTAGGDINIAAVNSSNTSATQITKGIYGGSTLNAGGDVSVSANSTNGKAEGIEAQGKSTVDITAGDNVDINVDADKLATGILAQDRGQVKISADEINIDVVSWNSNAYGLDSRYANSERATGITLEAENVTIRPPSENRSGGYGMSARNESGNDGTVYNNIVAKGSGFENGTATFGDTAALNAGITATYTMYADGGQKDGTSNNIIGSNLDDTIMTSGQMHATNKGVNRIMTGDGNDTITHKVSSIIALNSGENLIDAGEGKNQINIQSNIFAEYGGKNTILSGSGNDKITLKARSLHASNGGENLIDAGDGDNTITSDSWAYAASGGTTTVQAGSGNDIFTFNNSVSGTGAGSKTTIDAGNGDNSITIGGKAGNSNQVAASHGGSVEVKSGSGNDKMTFTSEVISQGTGASLSLDAGDGKNTITFDKVVKAEKDGVLQVSAGSGDDSMIFKGTVLSGEMQTLTGGNLKPMEGGSVIIDAGEGKNTIQVDGAVQAAIGGTINISAGDNDDSMLFKGNVLAGDSRTTTGGEVTIDAGEGNNSIQIAGLVQAAGGGKNTILTGSGDDTITQSGAAFYAVGGDNLINAGDGDNQIDIGGWVYASSGSKNTIQAGSGNDTMTFAQHLSSIGSGAKIIIDAGDGDNSITINRGSQVASTHGGDIKINAGSGDDTMTFTGHVLAGQSKTTNTGGSVTIDAGGGNNTIQVGGTVQAIADGSINISTGDGDDSITLNGSAIAGEFTNIEPGGPVVPVSGGSVTIDVGGGNNNIQIGGVVQAAHSDGIFTLNSGDGDDTMIFKGAIMTQAGGSASFNAGGGNNSMTFTGGIGGEKGARNTVSSGSGNDTLNIKLVTTGSDSHTVINTGSGDDTVNIGMDRNDFNGLYAYTGGLNEVTSNTINIHGNIWGLSASASDLGQQNDSTSNIVTGQNVNVSAGFGSADSYRVGMEAQFAGGYNVIQAHGSSVDTANGQFSFGSQHAITVVITAEAGSADDAIAMMASDGAVNYIVGSDLADNISITGSVKAYMGGENTISTGDGADTITLHGHVDSGALNIYAGEGYDTLVLVAESLDQFNDYYQDWLLDINDAGGMSIEAVNIQINDGSMKLTDLSWLTDSVNGVFANSGADIVVSAGEGFDSLGIDGFNGGNVSLSDLSDIISGFEALDMTGGDATTLNIDSLLDNLGELAALEVGGLSNNTSNISDQELANSKVLMVNGDGNDSVSFEGGHWSNSSAGTVDYGGTTYDIYTSTSGAEEQYMLIQQQININ